MMGMGFPFSVMGFSNGLEHLALQQVRGANTLVDDSHQPEPHKVNARIDGLAAQAVSLCFGQVVQPCPLCVGE
jgi:hypothetical protein